MSAPSPPEARPPQYAENLNIGESWAEQHRIEADQAISEYDDLEVDAGIMGRALQRIANPRPNKRFDPWAQDVAREALAEVSERVKGILA